jgi:O-antigen ligase
MDQRESIKDSKDLFHLVLFWVGYDYFRRDPGKIATFLRVSAGAGGLSAMVGLVQALNRGITLENRIRGFNDTYMTYAGLLSLAFVAAVAVTLYDYRKRQDAWIPPAMALMALAIVLSLTRSSFLGAMTGALVILIPRKPLAALVIPILVALGLALAPHGVSGRFSAMFDATSPANTERVHVWRGGARMLGDHPFFGVGQNCFPKAYPKFRDAGVVEKGISHLHNNMLELAVERGIPCMAAWISIWAAAYWLMIRAWRRGGGTRGPNALGLAAGIGGITAFLAEGMFEYNFGDAEPQMLALLILGAGMAAAARTEESFLPR